MKFVEIEKAEYDKAYNEMKQRKSLKENNDTIDYVIIDGHKILNLKEKFVGTAEYISPEVLENKFDLIGPGVDIWAFGVTQARSHQRSRSIAGSCHLEDARGSCR